MEQELMLGPFFLVIALILISAFFSGSETGLTGVAQAKIHKLKMEGNKRAITLSKLREDKERLIGAILLGNNVVNIAASAIATSLAIKYLGEAGVLYATAIMTVVVLVFAEVLPKTYSVRHAEQVALAVAPIFVLITKILAPFTMAVQVVVNRVISVISVAPKDDMSGVEVLRGAVDMYHEEGNVLKEDKDMLSGIFDLVETEVEEIMIHRSEMVSISIEEPIETIVKFIANSSHSRIPVWKEAPDKVVGIIHTKDIFKAAQNHEGELKDLNIQDYVREAWFIPETTNLKTQLKAFQENQKHIALVVDEFGSITGMVTLEDIIEEVVGDIGDEHDKPYKKRIRHYKDGSYKIDGDMTIRDINKEMEWNLADENYMTLAGLIMYVAQRIPEVDDIFELDDYMFKIIEKNGNQIVRVKVRKVDAKKENSVTTELVEEEKEQEQSKEEVEKVKADSDKGKDK